jgi:hypothetical protein
MNIVNRYLIDPLWMGWSPVLVVWCFVPALVCALGNSKRMLTLVESIWGDYNNTLKASVMGLTEQAAKTVTWTDSRGFLGLCGFSSTVWLFLCLCTTYGPFSLLSLHAWGASAVTTLLLIKPVLALVRVRGSGFVPESQTTAGRVAPYAALVCSVFAAMIAQHSDRMTATVPSMTYIHDQDVGKLLHAFVGYTAVLAVLMAFLCSHCGVLQDKKAQLHKAALYLCLIASAAGCYRSFYQTESAATLYVYLALGIAVAGYVQDIPVFART